MTSLFASLVFMCLAVDVAIALPIPQRASLSHLEAPRTVTLEAGFHFLFTTGERPRASTCPPRIPNVLGQLCCSPFLGRT